MSCFHNEIDFSILRVMLGRVMKRGKMHIVVVMNDNNMFHDFKDNILEVVMFMGVWGPESLWACYWMIRSCKSINVAIRIPMLFGCPLMPFVNFVAIPAILHEVTCSLRKQQQSVRRSIENLFGVVHSNIFSFLVVRLL